MPDLPEVKVRFTADTSQVRAEIADLMAQIKSLTQQAQEAGMAVAAAIESSLAAGLAQLQGTPVVAPAPVEASVLPEGAAPAEAAPAPSEEVPPVSVEALVEPGEGQVSA